MATLTPPFALPEHLNLAVERMAETLRRERQELFDRMIVRAVEKALKGFDGREALP